MNLQEHNKAVNERFRTLDKDIDRAKKAGEFQKDGSQITRQFLERADDTFKKSVTTETHVKVCIGTCVVHSFPVLFFCHPSVGHG